VFNVTVLACLVVFAPGVTEAQSLKLAGTLISPAEPVLWSGTVDASDSSDEIPECVGAHCERFDIAVNLPSGVWVNKPGGLRFRFVGPGVFDNLMLYVYRDGVRVAKSDGVISTAQSVLIPAPDNGLFSVYVVYDPTSVDAALPYEALAEVEYAPPQ
jgi:hypothetical protein